MSNSNKNVLSLMMILRYFKAQPRFHAETWRSHLKTGVHMKAVFWLGIIVLMQISRLRFKQSRISMLIPHIYVLGRYVTFFCDF